MDVDINYNLTEAQSHAAQGRFFLFRGNLLNIFHYIELIWI